MFLSCRNCPRRTPCWSYSSCGLIAGLHRLEAAKLLGRTEIYEELHPEAKNGGDRRSENFRTQNLRSDSAKSFVQDTAEKLGVSPRTVETHVQMAKNLVPAAKKIIREAGGKVTKQTAFKVSRLPPERQEEAARLLTAGEVPYSASGRRYASFEESVADLKNHDKDCSYTPDALLAELDSFIQKFHREFAWWSVSGTASFNGVLEQGRVTTPSYRVKRLVVKPREEWAIVENCHEPIIDRYDFDSVQKVLALDTRTSVSGKAVELFSGMICCGECSGAMIRKTVSSGM